MNRRKLLAALGAASAAGAVGTGAFSSAQLDREVTVNVADDTDAYLQLEPANTPNGQYAKVEDGKFSIDITDNDNGGEGLNPSSTFVANNVFDVRNAGTQEAELRLSPGDTSAGTLVFPKENVLLAVLPEDESVTESVTLDVGEQQRFGLLATVSEDFENPPIGDQITFIADAGGQ